MASKNLSVCFSQLNAGVLQDICQEFLADEFVVSVAQQFIPLSTQPNEFAALCDNWGALLTYIQHAVMLTYKNDLKIIFFYFYKIN